jgi:hypothetical protein
MWEKHTWRLTVLSLSLSLLPRETEVLKIRAGFRYIVVTMSNQNNLHEEVHSFVTNED